MGGNVSRYVNIGVYRRRTNLRLIYLKFVISARSESPEACSTLSDLLITPRIPYFPPSVTQSTTATLGPSSPQRPLEAIYTYLIKSTQEISTHSSIRDEASAHRLLLPHTSFLDIPLVVRQTTDLAYSATDVISKTPLLRNKGASALGRGRGGMTDAVIGLSDAIGLRVCVRCGSKAELRWLDRKTRVIGTSVNGMVWGAFVNEWEKGCVCGGGWVLSR